jgi:hypothetical protein
MSLEEMKRLTLGNLDFQYTGDNSGTVPVYIHYGTGIVSFILEEISEQEYKDFIYVLERLVALPFSYRYK